MSYYGYPNPGAYGANYQAYAAYAANAASYNQYQQAYNEAAYRAMQQQTQLTPSNQSNTAIQQGLAQSKMATPGGTNNPSGISISQPAQRYDYANMAMQQASVPKVDPATYGYAQPYGMNQMKATAGGVKQPWAPPGMSMMQQQAKKLNGNAFKKRRPPGTQVQQFYCEVCKISCAGPQTYKEHLDGQKHKKREQASKANEQQQPQENSNSTENQAQSSAGSLNRRNDARFSNRSSLVMRCELCDVACTGRDAYSAHIRGMKHQKTLKLHQKLGKPIPADAINPNLSVLQSKSVTYAQPQVGPIDPNESQMTAAPVEQYGDANVEQSQASVDQNGANNEANDQNMEDTSCLEPIGKEYIETRVEGKILSFYCKLCECQFNDPNAKDMHTKGRRHRLAYKKKVDPSLVVDMKITTRNKLTPTKQLERRTRTPRDRNNLSFNQAGDNNANQVGNTSIKPLMSGQENDVSNNPQTIQQFMSQPIKSNLHNINGSQIGLEANYNNHLIKNNETFDDRHIIAKHKAIFPTDDEINAIQEIVASTEKALKLVSDQVAEEDAQNVEKKSVPDIPVVNTEASEPAPDFTSSAPESSDPSKDDKSDTNRALKGVMRVGLLAKGLLLSGDTDVKLIVICADKPTKVLLERVYKILLEKIELVSPQIKYSIILDKEAETILIVKLPEIDQVQPLITCKVLLTSPLVRTNEEQEQADKIESGKPIIKSEDNSEEFLDKQRCLDSLADLRHAKWFQAKASQLQNCVPIIRILRDLCHRNPTWSPLTQWGLELLVEKSLSSSTQSLSIGEALRRVLECVSSGVLLPNGPGLLDPCQKELTDVADVLNNQQKEEITSSAQMALRLLSFKQIYKILGIECLSYHSNNPNRYARKRQLTGSENDNQVEEKKEKKEEDLDTSKDVANDIQPETKTE